MDYKILDVGCGSLKGHHPILESRTLRVDLQKLDLTDPICMFNVQRNIYRLNHHRLKWLF